MKPETALSLGAQLAQGSLDPVELTERTLIQAGEHDSIFISLTPERARAEALAARERIRLGLNRSVLDGVPLAWKDLFDLAGSITTAGSRIFSSIPAQRDAFAVYNAAAAGMVSVGKTNMTEFAYSSLGLNPHYGTPSCITGKDAPRVPGGSSSGSAIAVAKGIVSAAIGTDTAGSLRVPAAFNGLVSYKPSQSRHNRIGVAPLARSLDTMGVISHSLADCVAIDDIMRCGHIQDRQPIRPAASLFVMDTSLADDPLIEPAVWENLKKTAARLRQAGCRVEERPIEAVKETLETIKSLGWLGAIEAYAEFREILEGSNASALDSRVRKRLLDARDFPADRAVVLYAKRAELIRKLRMELQGAILLSPTVAHCAPLLEPVEKDADVFARVNLQTLRLPMIGSFLDMPAIVFPSGLDPEGNFTSIQISAPCGEDEKLLCTANGNSVVFMAEKQRFE
ncbi:MULTISPECIES: amidase family protein [unclassified Marinobacter]|uniref:amidase family protein n=1 Tax=unclassified Marinobacter TaxID=83889 RepID=UPI00200E53B3|nr:MULTISPECIES: amidase family protein [unclassified Marinobacter]MCL1488788.1 amidase [Marinobacter sp.]UQG58130.1 amidase [Marinobacter sp. M4C]UQG66935.1 amidase [Marinobacter sp. M2C]UQG71215.1 amidase [Marinobacter sp. M1C]